MQQHVPVPQTEEIEGGETQVIAGSEWKKFRMCRITGTRAGCVVKQSYQSKWKMLRTLHMKPSSFAQGFMNYGNQNEVHAEETFLHILKKSELVSEWKDAVHSNPGLFLDHEMPWASASPDGMLELTTEVDGVRVQRRAILEWKCPASKKNRYLTVEELKAKGHIYDITNHKSYDGPLPLPTQYHSQTQWNMGLGKGECCIFGSWISASSPTTELLCKNEHGECWSTPSGSMNLTKFNFKPDWFANAKAEGYKFWRQTMLRHEILVELGYLLPGELETDIEVQNTTEKEEKVEEVEEGEKEEEDKMEEDEGEKEEEKEEKEEEEEVMVTPETVTTDDATAATDATEELVTPETATTDDATTTTTDELETSPEPEKKRCKMAEDDTETTGCNAMSSETA